MTILHRPGDMPRRIDFVRWFAANTRTGLQEGKWTLDQLIETGRAYTPHSFVEAIIPDLTE